MPILLIVCKWVFALSNLCIKNTASPALSLVSHQGVANQSKRCAMCRQEIPADFLDHPTLLSSIEAEKEEVLPGGYQWFYEGRNGKAAPILPPSVLSLSPTFCYPFFILDNSMVVDVLLLTLLACHSPCVCGITHFLPLF